MLHLLKKIKPRKIKSDILFGTGDPCLTGQALGAIAVYMAMTGTFFNITLGCTFPPIPPAPFSFLPGSENAPAATPKLTSTSGDSEEE